MERSRCLDESEEGIPKDQDAKIANVYPWGKRYPPPFGFGNYAGMEAAIEDWPLKKGTFNHTFYESYIHGRLPRTYTIRNWRDRHPRTSPVGAYGARHGELCDLGGNVNEWCMEWSDPKTERFRILRGGSWLTGNSASMLSTYRYTLHPANRYSVAGFRIVLSPIDK